MASPSRRHFVAHALLASVVGACADPPNAPPPKSPQAPPAPPPARPPAPAAEGAITPQTIAEAETLLRVRSPQAAREQAARSWQANMGPTFALRDRPPLDDSLAPASVWNPRAIGASPPPPRANRLLPSRRPAPPLPASERELAHAPVAHLSQWLRQRKVTSRALTDLYLKRLEAFDPTLKCVITLTREIALEQADQADRELAQGRARGPLHGVPYGLKDLLDTAGVATTWGAEPYRTRVPREDSAVAKRLRDAGAVLVAKLSLGALALNDVWFGGQTKNPWLLEEGSSGSSAGSGSAVAAGCVGFAIGSETLGSIVSPSSRCGVTGLRPTFGRVARTGAMTLCWSLDKLGPMARGVEDTALVLAAINGPDPGDPSSVAVPFDFDADAPVKGLRVGYVRAWLDAASEAERGALEALKRAGMQAVEVGFPELPYPALLPTLFAEAAASFDELVRSGRVDRLGTPSDDAWPNFFRQARLLSAVDLVQADRLRRQAASALDALMKRVDLLLVPPLRDEALTATNFTGHPSLTLRAGFVEIDRIRNDYAPPPGQEHPALNPKRRVPQGVTLVGRLFDEATLCRAGMALERELGVAGEAPPNF